MPKKEKSKDIEYLANHEEVLGKLYEVFAIQQPQHQEFWKRFHNEEEIHAQWIKDLFEEVDAGKYEVLPGRFSLEAIKHSISKVNSLKNEAMQGSMTFVDQLNIALGMERELLEDRYFEVKEQDDPHLKILLDKLRIATDVHRERLFEELEKQKS